MSPTFTERINVNRSFSAGVYEVVVNFTGNIASIQLTTKPEYAATRQIVGTLIQEFGEISAQYDLFSGNDVIALDLPETTKLVFLPTTYLSDNYSLIIATAIVGNVINSSAIAPIPQLLLELPNRFSDIELGLSNLVLDAASLSSRTDALEISSLSVIPHTHPIGEITGLAAALATIPSLSPVNAAISALQLSDTSQNSAIGTVQTDVSNLSLAISNLGNAPTASASLSYTLVSADQALESNKKYLATVAGLVCSLPSNPAIGDVISLSTDNFTLRVNNGAAARRILNLSTLTNLGSANGIILKAYADIELVYVGVDLWKTQYRSRTVNNWLSEGNALTSLIFANNGDSNGLFSWLGTNRLTESWSNPITSGRLIGLASTVLEPARDVNNLADRSNASEFHSNIGSNAWIGFDIGGSIAINIKAYTLKSRSLANDRHLSNWVLEGSNTVNANTVAGFNGAAWDVLHSNSNNLWATATNVSANFTVGTSANYRYIRIRQAGANTGGDSYLTLGEIELYGDLFQLGGEVAAV